MKLLGIFSTLAFLTFTINVFAEIGMPTDYEKCLFEADIKAYDMTQVEKQKLEEGKNSCAKENSTEEALNTCLGLKQARYEQSLKDINRMHKRLEMACLKIYGYSSSQM
jgi:hypothetical protein